MSNKMRIFGCGGCGINIVGNLEKPLRELGDGFSDIELEYLDTSGASVKKFEHSSKNFHLVESKDIDGEVAGSGGLCA